MKPFICMLMLLSSLASSARAGEAVTLNHDGATLHDELVPTIVEFLDARPHNPPH